MGLAIFFKKFHKKEHYRQNLSSPIVSLIEDYAKTKEYFFFKDLILFHRSKSIYIPLMLFLPKSGIVLFSLKEWDYKELQTLPLYSHSNLEDAQNTLAYDQIHTFIKEKLLDLAQIETLPIINFAIFPNLTSNDYNFLDDKVQVLLPQEKIFFEETTLEDIEEKLNALPKQQLPPVNEILPYLINEYMIIDQDQQISFANSEQREFIDTPLSHVNNLNTPRLSGKTHLLVLKTIREKLHNPDLKIAFVVPSKLHIYILKQVFVSLIEKSCIFIDMDEILFFTPSELIKFHATKINKTLQNYHEIDPILLKKGIPLADIVLCDDSHCLSEEFIEYLKFLQKNKHILFVNASNTDITYTLTKSYKTQNEIIFHTNNSLSYLLRELYNTLDKDQNASILICIDTDDLEPFLEDINSFTGHDTDFVDPQQPQLTSTQIQIAPVSCKVALHATYTFILTADDTNLSILKYLVDSSKKTTFILYNDKNENIQQFQKEVYAKNQKDETAMARDTHS